MANYKITWSYNGMDSIYQLVEVNGRYNLENVVDGHLLVDYGWNAVEELENGLNVIDKISKWSKEESTKTEAELLKEWSEQNGVITVMKPKQVETVEGLTEKEVQVLKAMYNGTDELGLPVETDYIKEQTGLSKRSIVGVVSSLYKKGLVEEYNVDSKIDNEFMLSEEGYNKAESL